MAQILKHTKRTGTACPRWGWSGVAEVFQPSWSNEKTKSLIALLPVTRSTFEQMRSALLCLGAKHRRNLHQDEFGPTRAEQMAALRTLLDHLDVVISRFMKLPENIRSKLSDQLACQVSRPSFSPFDDAALEQLYEAAVDLEPALIHENAADDARLVAEVHQSAKNAYEFLLALDTNTAGEIFLDTLTVKLPPNESEACDVAPVSDDCGRVAHLRQQFQITLRRLEAQKGPAPAKSLPLLAWQLCDLWQRETGQPVTNSAVRQGHYTSAPQSAAGKFVVAAAEAAQPSPAWIEKKIGAEPIRRRIFALSPSHRARIIYYAIRAYVAVHVPSGVRRGHPKSTKVTL